VEYFFFVVVVTGGMMFFGRWLDGRLQDLSNELHRLEEKVDRSERRQVAILGQYPGALQEFIERERLSGGK
jgi:hypothetical protein